MLSWWSNIHTVALVNNWLLAATVVLSAATGFLAFLTARKSKAANSHLLTELEIAKKQVKSIEKTAEEIRKELLQTQQYQDINQLKLKTSKSSTEELRQALVQAQKRLEAAEKAAREQEAKAVEQEERFESEKEKTDSTRMKAEHGLTESRREQLMDLLDPGPKGNVDIFCVLDDELSTTTANQLESILSADGWKTKAVAQSAFADPPKGLVLAVNSKETAPSYASFLQRVFTTIGMPISATVDQKYREWSLTIIVGTFADDRVR